MRPLRPLILATLWAVAIVPSSSAQNSSASSAATCLNFGLERSGAPGGCDCPPGFGSGVNSDKCDLAMCGGSLYSPSDTVGAGQFGNLSSCQCADGWTGPACTVCQTNSACQQSLTHYINSTNQLGVPGVNSTLVCSVRPQVYAAGHMTCNVVQALLSSLFPGKTQLTISRFLNSSSTPGGIGGLQSANLLGGVGEAWAQLWYNSTEQFYCHASECTQTVTDGSHWSCPKLQCKCRPGTSFCGGGTSPTQNLSAILNALSGPLDIICTGNTCTFDQQFLRTFGPSGLPLSDCTFGECVNQFVIDKALGVAPAALKSSSKLSGGVIAGLAVVGAVLLGIVLLALWGIIRRNKARKIAGDATLVKKDGGVGMAWHHVGYQVSGRGGRGLYSRTISWLRGFGNTERASTPESEDGNMTTSSGGRLILRDACGELPPGAFCCILGPSGAGKSTLVDILAGRRKTGVVEGKVSFLTDTPDRSVKIGYCDQSDVLSPTSTVLETLIFAAKLRLPENVPDSTKEQRAVTVIEQLGLSHIAHTRVGSGTHRGISGGEMRRVSIGVELVANPDILILDEPTSGLDSVSAARVISLLKSLTVDPENKTTIVASIHQPSSALYREFSQVILLAKGRQLYFGPAGNKPAEFFAAQGRPCPSGYNVADHLLEVATESNGVRCGSDAVLPTSSRDHSITSDEKSTAAHHHTDNNGTTVPTVGHQHSNSVGKEVDLAKVNAQVQKVGWWPRTDCATTFLTQFEVLAVREWRILKRDKALFAAHFLIAGIVGVFGGGCFFRTGVTIGGFQNKVGSMFFLGSLIAFSSLSALNTIFEVRPLFLRERSSNFYSPQTWILSRIVFDIIPLRIIPTILLSIIVYFMVGTIGIDSNAAMFFKFLLIAVEFSIVMVLYNFLVAAVIDHYGVAILLSSLWTMLNFIYAGFFSNTSQMPPVLRWIRYIAPMSYTLEALTVNWIKSMVIKDELSGVPIEISGVVIMETLFGFNVNAYYRNVLVLFAFIAGFGIMLVLGVFWFMREKR